MDEKIELDEITPSDSIVPIFLQPLTDEELRAQEESNLLEKKKLDEIAKAKKSGMEKLKKLGLTENEIEAVIK